MNHYSYEDLYVGLEESFNVTISDEMMEQFCNLTGDKNPLHNEDEFAVKRGFEKHVVYGMLTSSFLSTLAGMYLPGEKSLIHRIEAEFPKPVYVGDCLTVVGKIQEKNDTFRTVIMKIIIINQKKDKVCRGKMRVGFLEERI